MRKPVILGAIKHVYKHGERGVKKESQNGHMSVGTQKFWGSEGMKPHKRGVSRRVGLSGE